MIENALHSLMTSEASAARKNSSDASALAYQKAPDKHGERLSLGEIKVRADARRSKAVLSVYFS